MGATKKKKIEVVTTIEYARISSDGKKGTRKRAYYKTGKLSAAMRRFFAERGDDTELMPTRVWQSKYAR